MIPEGERTCVLETETELWLHELRPQFFSLEERDANVEGAGRITMQDLFNAPHCVSVRSGSSSAKSEGQRRST